MMYIPNLNISHPILVCDINYFKSYKKKLMTILTNTYQELSSTLLDSSKCLSIRFRALFTLKSLATHEAIDIISQGAITT